MVVTFLALAALSVWLTMIAARGLFWQARETDESLPPLPPARAKTLCAQGFRMTAVVPARDEAETIGRCVTSLLGQQAPFPFDVVVVDDQSADGTGALARAAAEAIGAGDRLIVLRADDPPPGWTGKLNAMRTGLAFLAARPAPPTHILFTDADIEHAPDVATRLAGGLADGRAMVSLMAHLSCQSRAERWLTPAFVYFFAMLYPFAWVNDPRRPMAAAAGGCMAVDRAALERAGGLTAIRGALIDDCALGAAMKRVGPIWLGLSQRVVSLRACPTVADIRRMVVRSAYAELRYHPIRLAGALAGMGVAFLAPLFLAVAADPWIGVPALIAYALMALSYGPMAARYGVGRWRGLALPAIAAAYMAFTIESAVVYARGRGGAWKGRYQAASDRR